MTRATNGDVVKTLAKLEATLEIFIDEFKREREYAGNHRKDLRDVIGALSAAVQNLTAQVAEMRPKLEVLDDNRLIGVGVTKLARIIGHSVSVLAGMVGAAILWLLQHFISGSK